jgi:hypothetical protein
MRVANFVGDRRRPGPHFYQGWHPDDTSWLGPEIRVYCDSAQRWMSVPEDSQKFAKMLA